MCPAPVLLAPHQRIVLCNRYVHLTNVAIQKTGDGYNRTHGGKWRLKMLKLWVQGIYGQTAAAKLFRDMYGTRVVLEGVTCTV